VVPSGYVGAYPEVGRRLVVAAAKQPAGAAVACAGEWPVGRARVRRRDALLSQCPAGAGPHRGGPLLRWREGGTVMAVSMTGHPSAAAGWCWPCPPTWSWCHLVGEAKERAAVGVGLPLPIRATRCVELDRWLSRSTPIVAGTTTVTSCRKAP